ncbi:MAG: MFS transporter [Gemmatimonadaceae bacterium]|nr:MFS transporter [Gemmatimonadaceae bacterium]
MAEVTTTSDAQRRAAWSTRVQFLNLGLVAGAYGAHVPSIAQVYALDARALAGTMLCATLGSLTMLVAAGRLIGHLGARRASVVGGLAFCVAIAALLRMPSVWALLPVMMLLGAGENLFDIAINAEGTMLEQLGGRAIMSGFHAMFSVGAMIGSAIIALLFRLEAAPVAQLLGLALVLAALLVGASRGMLPAHPADDGAHFAWPRGVLLMIGLLILAGMLAEGVMYNWSVLYVRESLGAPADRAALAYVAFSAATAAMRFAGDAVRSRVAERTVLIAGAVLASVAMIGVLLAANQSAAFVGFALVGAGLATVVPILYNATTRVPGVSRAAALASASSIGYVGFLLGPPLVGSLAHALSLRVAMGVLVVACAVLVLGSGTVPLAPRPARIRG